MIKSVQGYANTGSDPNKQFTWRVHNLDSAKACLKRLEAKGWVIKAAWYNVMLPHGIRYSNTRIR